MGKFKGALFDLDGVIVDTAKYHYLAWKRLAKELGFDFKEEDNERLKGVSRMRSLDILLEVGRVSVSEEDKLRLAAKKNAWYVDYLKKMDDSELLSGAKECLISLRERGVKTALGSASKNTPLILEKLDITPLFDAIVDGNKVSAAKPDPEVFLRAASEIRISPGDCVVFEDAQAGIEAGKAAGCYVVGIGQPGKLSGADKVINGLNELNINSLFIETGKLKRPIYGH